MSANLAAVPSVQQERREECIADELAASLLACATQRNPSPAGWVQCWCFRFSAAGEDRRHERQCIDARAALKLWKAGKTA